MGRILNFTSSFAGAVCATQYRHGTYHGCKEKRPKRADRLANKGYILCALLHVCTSTTFMHWDNNQTVPCKGIP